MAEQLKHSGQTEKGMALVLVLVFTAILLSLGAVLITNAVSEKLIASYNTIDTKLYYITEAGAEAGIAAVNQVYAGEDFDLEIILSNSLNGGSFKVTFEESSNDFIDEERYLVDIVSVGTLDNYNKVLTVTVHFLEDEANIHHWHKPTPLR